MSPPLSLDGCITSTTLSLSWTRPSDYHSFNIRIGREHVCRALCLVFFIHITCRQMWRKGGLLHHPRWELLIHQHVHNGWNFLSVHRLQRPHRGHVKRRKDVKRRNKHHKPDNGMLLDGGACIRRCLHHSWDSYTVCGRDGLLLPEEEPPQKN